MARFGQERWVIRQPLLRIHVGHIAAAVLADKQRQRQRQAGSSSSSTGEEEATADAARVVSDEAEHNTAEGSEVSVSVR